MRHPRYIINKRSVQKLLKVNRRDTLLKFMLTYFTSLCKPLIPFIQESVNYHCGALCTSLGATVVLDESEKVLGVFKENVAPVSG